MPIAKAVTVMAFNVLKPMRLTLAASWYRCCHSACVKQRAGNPSLLSVRGTKRNGHLVRRHTSTLIGINSPTAAGCYLSGDRRRGHLLWSNARNVYTTCQLYGRDDDSSDDMDSDGE